MKNDLCDVDRMVVSLKTAIGEALAGPAAFQFEICATEALTNLVRHASALNKSDPILIELVETADSLDLVIFDPIGATPFDLRNYAKDLDDVEPLAEGGRGLGLILRCSDAVNYFEQDGRTRLVLTFTKSGEL